MTPTWKALQPSGSEGAFVSAKKFGLRPSATDQLDKLQVAIDAMANPVDGLGGILALPEGEFFFDGQIVGPKATGSYGASKSFGIIGNGGSANGRAQAPNGGTIVRLGYDGANAKILWRGGGQLYLDHMSLVEPDAATTTPFVLVTGTTLKTGQGLEFYGHTSKSWLNCDQDAIIMGGPTTVESDSPTEPFQGYGSLILAPYFNRIRRGVLGQVYCNGVVVIAPEFWNQCGSNLAAGKAIEFIGAATNVCSGNMVIGGIVEMLGYAHAVGFEYANENVVQGLSAYDPGNGTGGRATSVGLVYCGPNAQSNKVTPGFVGAPMVQLTEDPASAKTNTLISSKSNEPSQLARGAKFAAPVTAEQDLTVTGGPSKFNVQPAGTTGNEGSILMRIARAVAEATNGDRTIMEILKGGAWRIGEVTQTPGTPGHGISLFAAANGILRAKKPSGATHTFGQGVIGRVSAAGAVAAGTQFTVTKNATGDYTITYSTAFADTPIVNLVGHGDAWGQIVTDAVGSTRVLFKTPAGAAVDTAFQFTAFLP